MAKGLNDILNLLLLELAVKRRRIEIEARAGTDRQALAGLEVGHIATVAQLYAGFSALGMNTIGEALEVVLNLVVDI